MKIDFREVLLTSIDRIYKRILDDLIKTGVSTLFKILRGSILFNVVKEIYFRIYHSYRCTWGKSLIIDSKGDVYHCDSTVGYKEDFQGNYKTGITKDFYYIPSVNIIKNVKNVGLNIFAVGLVMLKKY